MQKTQITDITQELFSCQVYPGDMPPTFERVRTVEKDKCNVTNISMCVHNGTHIDAPCHFVAGAKAIDELDLEIFYGKCTVAQFCGVICEADILPVLNICHKRLLLKGDCELSEGAARLVADSHIRLIGVESQSVGSLVSPLANHLILLGAEVIALEGLRLAGVLPGEYVLSAFPLNMGGSDGSPVRAVLIESV
ncbi:MAG: cyclase family protein [Oscillospiraceae bacterium]|nr:cyclase family protein [Oscillospiraceae bacterium]